jgi:predicted small integral membrane protein
MQSGGIFDLSWMAWTWPTAVFFIAIFASIAAMGVWEYYAPGGGPRHGIFRLDTTRGDRLFISILGSCFIMLGWVGFVSTVIWGGLAVCVLWAIFVFKWV